MKLKIGLVILALACGAEGVRAQDPDDRSNSDATAAAQKLASSDPATRQLGAEDLARMAALEQLRLVEGYRLQEKDKQVRLALDWALYRLGKPEKLYPVVSELAGKRGTQAAGYLAQLEGPRPLYVFLNDTSGKTLVGVLEALGHIGTAETLSRIKVFQSNFVPEVANAAKNAEDEINQRLAQTPPNAATRDRVAPVSNQPSPDDEPSPDPEPASENDPPTDRLRAP